MKYSGLVPHTVDMNAANASCKIILLFWNFGSVVYGLFQASSSITSGCCGVPIRPNLVGVFSGIGDACTVLCIAACALNLLFLFGDVLALFLACLPLGYSYQSGGFDFSLQVGMAVWSPLRLAEKSPLKTVGARRGY